MGTEAAHFDGAKRALSDHFLNRRQQLHLVRAGDHLEMRGAVLRLDVELVSLMKRHAVRYAAKGQVGLPRPGIADWATESHRRRPRVAARPVRRTSGNLRTA